jgi:hypothetical protein
MKIVFEMLLEWIWKQFLALLEEHGELKGGSFLSSGEKLMIFIHTCVGHSSRQCAERFQHSTSTISIVIQEVIGSILMCRKILIKGKKEGDLISGHILNNPKFFPYFEHCIGALDGTHIMAIVSPDLTTVFRSRKGQITQNVLGVVDFDMLFLYVLAGWEGSAHDGRVFDDAKLKGLKLILYKYYLGDAV